MLQQNVCYHRYRLKGLAQGGKAEKGVLRASVAREQWPRTFSWPCPVGDSREGGAQSWETKLLQAGGWEERKSFIGDSQVFTQAQQQNGGRSSCRAGQRASRWQMLGVLVRLENGSQTCPPKNPALDSVSLKLWVPLQHPREDSLKHMVFFFLTNAAKSIKKKLFAVNIYLTLNRLLAVQAPK